MVAPVKFGDEILVNTTTAAAQNQPSVAALKNGKFVVVWHDLNQPASGGDPSVTTVRGQLFNADGSKSGAEFLVPTLTDSFQQDPTVITLNDGRFVVAWESFNHDAGDPQGSYIAARIFNENGTPATNEFLVNTHTDWWQSKPTMAPLANGGFIVTWMHDFQGGNVNFDVFCRIYDANGNPVGDDFGVAVGSEIESAPVVTGLANNKYMIAWKDDGGASLNDGSGSHVGSIVLTGNNHQPLNGPQFIANSTTANDQSVPAIVTLDDGNVVMVFNHVAGAGNVNIRGRLFNSTGTPLANDFSIDGNSGVIESDPAVVAMAGGQYLVSWTDFGSAGETDGDGSHIRAAIMSGSTGSNVSGDFIVNTSTAGDQSESTVTMLADGRILVVWTDSGLNPGDTSGAAIRAQIFDPRTAGVVLNGTSRGDDWCGTAFADTLNGLNGDDTLNGGGGADNLIGGGGTDTADYSGSPSAVTVNLTTGTGTGGDAQGDILNGIENVTGSAFADKLIGDGSANELDGGGGNDELIGGGGADNLIGGGGTDTADYSKSGAAVSVNLIAGTGVGGDAQGDTLNGVENIRGSAFGDTMTGDDNSNRLFGSGGNDELYGNGGADTLVGGAGADKLSGGGGQDVVDYSGSSAAVSINLVAKTGVGGDAQGDNNFGNIDDVIGSAFGDTITGDSAGNRLIGLGGNDELYGNEGNDTLLGGAGADKLSGGPGQDLADYSHSPDGVAVDLLTKTGAFGDAQGDNGFSNIEDLTGSAFGDQLSGDGAANRLMGGAGEDELLGRGGADMLFGGGAADQFIYVAIGDSLPGAVDIINDFNAAQNDKINLFDIDASTLAGGDQAFSFIGGGAFTGVAGQLRFAGGFVEGDVTGDGGADFRIQVNVGSLVGSDFIL